MMWCFSKTLTLLRATVQGETPTSSGNAEDSTSVDMLQTRSLGCSLQRLSALHV